ncbi:protein kinase [Bacteroidota bacterium]
MMNEKSEDILFEKFRLKECYKKDEHSAVYLADHLFLEKKVILKVLNRETISDSSKIDRFKREAKILAKLDHPNIIRVIDFGSYKEYFYISSEYFDGVNLRVQINRKELTFEEKSKLLFQLLNGLDYAHDNNIIHRDIKPENILVNNDLDLKLSDFGLAQILEENFITKKSVILGTPSYMSPEQINGERLTIQSDLFSVGILALELFTKENPFIGRDINETINNIISFRDETVAKLVNKLPQKIQTIIDGLLRRDKQKRFKTCKEPLNHLVSHPDDKVTQTKSNFKRKVIISGAVILIIFSATLAVLIFSADQLEPETENITFNQSLPISEKIQDNESLGEDSVRILTNNQTTEIELKDDEGKIEEFLHPTDNEEKSDIIKSEEIIPIYGNLYVECFPWADIYINGKKIDTTPLEDKIELEVGKYNFRLLHPEYPEYRTKINVFENQNHYVKINLDTLHSFIDFKVHPWGDIYIDGIAEGQTPIRSLLKVSPGNHEIRIEHPEYFPRIDTFYFHSNDTMKIRHNFIKN